MALRTKRSDTLIRNVEKTYGINLNVRGDTKLGTVLDNRGYNSQSQLVKAIKGNLNYHPFKRNIFVSFHSNDFAKAQGLRLMFMNQNLNFDLKDVSRKSVRSDNESYVRNALRSRIKNADVVICVLGNGTGSRDWIDWELETALSLRIPICGVRIPNTFGKFPEHLKIKNASVAEWAPESIISVIEATIARGV